MLPSDVDIFLRKHIDSIEGLEILLMLYHDGGSELDVAQCAERLGVPEHICQRQLELLTTGGLLTEAAGRYRFGPKSVELERAVQRFIEIYGKRRLEVINAIIGRSLDRMRELADAFRLRKEKKDG